MEVVRTVHPAEDAGKALTNVLRVHAHAPILLMVSGGSAFQILDFVESEVLGSNLTLTVLDERFSRDHTVNNFAQLEQTSFYEWCIKKGAGSLSTKVEKGESLHDLRLRHANALSQWKEEHPYGLIIVTMGIGPDGHTAGIFPGEQGVDFNNEEWVVGYIVPKEVNEHSERMTVTHTFLQEQVEEAIVYAVGSEKRGVIERLQTDDCDSFSLPACILRHMKNTTLFTNEVDV